jgi:hypothetical protein
MIGSADATHSVLSPGSRLRIRRRCGGQRRSGNRFPGPLTEPARRLFGNPGGMTRYGHLV